MQDQTSKPTDFGILRTLKGEVSSLKSTKTEHDARSNIKKTYNMKTYFDFKNLDSLARWWFKSSSDAYKYQESIRKSKYEQQINDVESNVLTVFVFVSWRRQPNRFKSAEEAGIEALCAKWGQLSWHQVIYQNKKYDCFSEGDPTSAFEALGHISGAISLTLQLDLMVRKWNYYFDSSSKTLPKGSSRQDVLNLYEKNTTHPPYVKNRFLLKLVCIHCN